MLASMKHAPLVLAIILLVSFANAESGFSPDGQLIQEVDFAQLHLPTDLNKTNLRIAVSNDQNPLEWAGRIQSFSSSGIFPCNGGVVALPGYRLHDKALVLTAGHCVNIRDIGRLPPKRVLLNEPLKQEIYFDFPRSRQTTSDDGQRVKAKRFFFNRIVFASFDVVDLALLEMNQTYEQLQYGTQKPPMLVRRAFKMNEDVTAFGIPATAKYQSVRFHLSTCKTTGVLTYHSGIGNIEDPSLAYDLTRRVLLNCTLLGGMSGGFIRDSKGHVIGVNSGGMRDGPSFYAGTAPLTHCATKDGHLNQACLAALKTKIENWSGKENKQ